MMKRKALLTLMAASMLTIGGGTLIHAAFDENLNMYTLDAVVVEADKTKNKFGDTITEQSYYRTGGDVKVITREEIEKRHYTDATEAIKRIPGVTFTNAGYRGGEYGFNDYNNSMAINGDTHVIVLVDGRRVDNQASTRFGKSNADGGRTAVDLNQVISMEDVEKIEVIKGPGASIYGADATGGVINFITRKGGDETTGAIDLSTGSWNKHVYNVSLSGALGDNKSTHYFLSASRQMAGNSKYHDNITNADYAYEGTAYKEDGVTARLDKDFSDTQNLKIWYNHQNGKDGYPITARMQQYWTQADWDRIIERTTRPGGYGNTDNPGYRNLFSLDALSGSYNAYRTNDLDVSYTFNKDNGMESFVRVYRQSHNYWGLDTYPDWIDADGNYVPFPGGPKWDAFIKQWKKDNPEFVGKWYHEDNRGIQLQYGKSVGIHDILGSVTFDKSKVDTRRWNRKTKTWTTTQVKRNSVLGFVQDKIHINDRWDFTPALRYSHYSTFDNVNDSGTTSVENSSSSNLTPTINTEYAFNDSLSAYLGWTKIYRPIKANDYGVSTPNGGKLEDEKGNVWTFGVSKDFGENTTFAVHYDWTDMSNAVTYYSVYNQQKQDFESKAVNAKETKKSFNMTLDHQFNDKWSLSLAYTRLDDKYEAKDGMTFDPDISLKDTSNVNTMINALRPANHYTANLSYQSGKWYTGLLANWYTGMNTTAFTTRRALVLDWNLNYDWTKELTTYVTITNLTNEGYENAYSEYNGIGAAPQPGRAFMVGARYKF